MAKKKKDKNAGRADAVRSAVDQAFQATAEQAETARGRAQDIVEEFAQAAGRVREALEDLRPAGHEEIADLRRAVERLDKRVADLEAKKAPARRPAARAKKPAASKTTASRPTTGGS